LLLHLVVVVETGVVLLFIVAHFTFAAISWLRPFLLAVQLVLELLTSRVMLEAVWEALRLRRGGRWSISQSLPTSKLESVVIVSSLPALTCFLEVLQLIWWSEAVDGPDCTHFTLTLGLFVFHVAAACALILAVSQPAGGPRHSPAPGLPPMEPAFVEACEFAAVPATARTQHTCCAICLVDFEDSDVVLPLPCRHVFHAGCLSKWLRRSAACPMRCGGARLCLPESRTGPGREPRERQRGPLPAPAGSRPEEGADAGGPGEENDMVVSL